MVEVDRNGNISLSRGDVVRLPIVVNTKQNPEVGFLHSFYGDVNVYFFVVPWGMEPDRCLFMKKVEEYDSFYNFILTLYPEETAEIEPGNHQYCIVTQCVYENKTVSTCMVAQNRKFTVEG